MILLRANTLGFLFFFANIAISDVVTVPIDLSPGDQYRLVYVTSQQRRADSTDIDVYNDFVNSIANNINGNVGSQLAGISQWKAIGSTSSIDAIDNTNTNPSTDGVGVPIYSVNGARLADNYADFWDDDLFADIGGANSTESGGTPPLVNIMIGLDVEWVYTGSFPDGTVNGTAAIPLPKPLGANTAILFGSSTLIPGNEFADSWIAAGQGSKPGSFYGMSNILSVPVPEPSAAFYCLMVSLLCCVACRSLVISPNNMFTRCKSSSGTAEFKIAYRSPC